MMETIGAMYIGPIQAALGSNDLLYFKSAIDSVSSFILVPYTDWRCPRRASSFFYERCSVPSATFLCP